MLFDSLLHDFKEPEMSVSAKIADELDKQIRDGMLKSWEFYYIDKEALTRFRLTPQFLKTSPDYRVRVGVAGASQLRSLTHALRETTLVRSTASPQPDCRYGLVCRTTRHDASKKPHEQEFLTLFLDKFAKSVLYNGNLYDMEGSLKLWFEHLASTLTKLT